MDIVNLARLTVKDALNTKRPASGLDSCVKAAASWLCRAHDKGGGGVSLGYHLRRGWMPAYPETTGYIIPTFFRLSDYLGDGTLSERAIRMGDWEVEIQLPSGAYQGGFVGGKDVKPSAFNTGQILFGLLACHCRTKEQKYLDAAVRAGDFLVRALLPEGIWPAGIEFCNTPHAYNSRIDWALFLLGKATGDDKYVNAARRNLEWSLSQQQADGWFDANSFERGDAPITHTIAYVIRGHMECGALLQERKFSEAAKKSVAKLARISVDDERPAGTYSAGWKGDHSFTCVTGNCQFAGILGRAHQIHGDKVYVESMNRLSAFNRTMVSIGGHSPDVTGALPGSYPLWGKYQRFCFPNWAAKFFVDSLLIQREIETGEKFAPDVAG